MVDAPSKRLQVRTLLLLLNPLRALRVDLQDVDRRSDVFASRFYFSFYQPPNPRDKSILPEVGSILRQTLDRICLAEKSSYYFALAIIQAVVGNNHHANVARNKCHAKLPYENNRTVAFEAGDRNSEKRLPLKLRVKLVLRIASDLDQLGKEF